MRDPFDGPRYAVHCTSPDGRCESRDPLTKWPKLAAFMDDNLHHRRTDGAGHLHEFGEPSSRALRLSMPI